MAEKNSFDITKLICVAVWCSGQRVACTCRWTGFDFFSFFVPFVVVVVVFLFSLCFLVLFFLLACFSFFLLLTLLIMHLDKLIYILRLSLEFYFGKGISKVLNLHTGQAYHHKETISCQDMSLLWNSWIFYKNVSWHHDEQHTVHHKLYLYLYPTPTSDPLAKFKLSFCTSS